jgi:hypothetical protein
MINLKNYFKQTSVRVKKLGLYLKGVIGTASGAAYIQNDPKLAFYLLLAGALITGLLELLPPDDELSQPEFKKVSNAALIALIVLPFLALISSCTVLKPGVDHTKTDTTITSYKQVDVKVSGAKVFAGLGTDDLLHLALAAKDQRMDDSIARLKLELKYKQDSIAALKANKPIPLKPLYVPPAPQKQYVTDPETKAQLSYWIDAYGKFQIECESKDQTIHTQQAEITKLTKDVTTQKLLTKVTPTWNWIAMAVLGTLLLISVLLNVFNRKSN